MSKKQLKVSGAPETDPTLTKVPVSLSGRTYHLVFTFAALAIAEREFRVLGTPLNIFSAFDFNNLDAEKTVALLYAAMLTDAPDTQLGDVPSLISLRDIPAIRTALAEAFNASMVEPEADTGPLAEA